jgi:6-phosphofructokinase 1
MKNIAVLTSGGDSPGMNACIRAIVRSANQKGIQVYGIQYGYKGLINNDFNILAPYEVGNTIHIGGTILKSERSQEFRTKKGRNKAYNNLQLNNIDGLIVLGGDGSLTGAKIFVEEFNFKVIGIPCTIDNDIYGTDYSIGFSTARETVVNAIDKIRDTASSHERIFIVEVMGRESGFLALESGVASGAELILIPENKNSMQEVIHNIKEINDKKKSVIIVYAEGCNFGTLNELSKNIKNNIKDSNVRVSILGHIQRGGIPSSSDRILGSVLGYESINKITEGVSNKMIGIRDQKPITVDLYDAISKKKEIDLSLNKMSDTISKY